MGRRVARRSSFRAVASIDVTLDARSAVAVASARHGAALKTPPIFVVAFQMFRDPQILFFKI